MADYTKLNSKEIHDILSQYDLGEIDTALPLSGGQANSSYRLKTASGSFTLSVCDEKSVAELGVLSGVLTCLEVQGFPCPRLIRTARGRDFIEYKGKPVYVKEFWDGEVVPKLDHGMLVQVGGVMARLHQLPCPENLPRAFPYGMPSFKAVLSAETAHPFKPWLREKVEWLSSRLNLNMARGFIHGDIFWDNLLFNGDRLAAVLDFEEACHYYLLYDLGMAAVGCCSAGEQVDWEKVRQLIKGYESVRPLTAVEKAQFIPFFVYAATAAAFWRFRQYNLRYPDSGLADYYKELAALADEAQGMKDFSPA